MRTNVSTRYTIPITALSGADFAYPLGLSRVEANYSAYSDGFPIAISFVYL